MVSFDHRGPAVSSLAVGIVRVHHVLICDRIVLDILWHPENAMLLYQQASRHHEIDHIIYAPALSATGEQCHTMRMATQILLHPAQSNLRQKFDRFHLQSLANACLTQLWYAKACRALRKRATASRVAMLRSSEPISLILLSREATVTVGSTSK